MGITSSKEKYDNDIHSGGSDLLFIIHSIESVIFPNIYLYKKIIFFLIFNVSFFLLIFI